MEHGEKGCVCVCGGGGGGGGWRDSGLGLVKSRGLTILC